MLQFTTLFYRFKSDDNKVKKDEDLEPRSACSTTMTFLEFSKDNTLVVTTKTSENT